MLRNLKAEISRNGVSYFDIATAINKTDRCIRDKLNEKYEFTLSEATKIRNKFFPGMTLEYLFASDKQKN
ncbi:MAG: XRE family transcriptional regulator [Lachnospiraceae bacterium]